MLEIAHSEPNCDSPVLTSARFGRRLALWYSMGNSTGETCIGVDSAPLASMESVGEDAAGRLEAELHPSGSTSLLRGGAPLAPTEES